MKKLKRYLVVCMIFGAMICFSGCGNRNNANKNEATSMHNNATDMTNTTTNHETTHNNKETTSVMDSNVENRNRNGGNVIEDIESGVKDIGDDVSRAVTGNR